MSARKLPPNEVVLDLARSGMTQVEIARQYGATQRAVGRILQRFREWKRIFRRTIKAKKRVPLKWKGKSLELLIAKYRELRSIARTARALGTNKTTVRRALKRAGEPILSQSETQSGELNPQWQGGISHDRGRVLIYRPDHPHATKAKYVRRSRLVAERVNGRLLSRKEVVHHENEKVADDRPRNLRVFRSNGEHLRVTRTGKKPKISAAGRERIRAALRKRRKKKGGKS